MIAGSIFTGIYFFSTYTTDMQKEMVAQIEFMEKESKNADCTYVKFWGKLSGSDSYV